jgi:isopentenyldiphosphate isomerase
MSKYELIDIVDDNDNIIKTIERTPEWNKSRPDTFRVVNVFVWTTDGKVVVQQRSRRKSAGPLQFDTSVGGLVTSGLSYKEAAIKEMKEELGLEGELKFVSSFKDIISDTGRVFSHNHLFEIISDGPYRNWEDEAERLEFMTLDEAKELSKRYPYLFTPGFVSALDAYLAVQ